MKISVLGVGRWASFIAWYLNKIGLDVTIWGRSTSKRLQKLISERRNDYLIMPDSVNITDNLYDTVRNSNIIVISISAQSLRDLMQSLKNYDLNNKIIVLCMKGIEASSGKLLTDVAKEFINEPIAVWMGPGHVQDFVKGIPNCMVIDSSDDSIKRKLVKLFSSDLIRFYFGTDLLGNEIGAAAKNVIGIAAGMLDGLGYGSLKGALMSRGTREIARLIKAMGGNEISAYGLCHLGDYQATLFSEYSHNRKFGEFFVLGKNYDKLAEGVPTCDALVLLGEKFNVDLPICNAVKSIIDLEQKPYTALSKLFMRSLKNEF